ncbi:MAG: YqhR family membrane protein [Paenibacillaceae bacterium]
MKKIYFALYIGVYAGIIWGLVRWMFYILQFTKVLPAFLIKPFFSKTFVHSWIGHLSGIGAFILLSFIASLIYAIFLRKLKGPWPGIIYGIVWWFVVCVLIGPLIRMQPALWKLDLNSILCDACVFTLWGVFIGYSITLEFTDERNYEPQAG